MKSKFTLSHARSICELHNKIYSSMSSFELARYNTLRDFLKQKEITLPAREYILNHCPIFVIEMMDNPVFSKEFNETTDRILEKLEYLNQTFQKISMDLSGTLNKLEDLTKPQNLEILKRMIARKRASLN